MRFLVKVKVNVAKLKEFGMKLQKGELDRSLIKSETYCLFDDPAIGYSIWEAESRSAFEEKFEAWANYYSETDIRVVISANEAFLALMKK